MFRDLAFVAIAVIVAAGAHVLWASRHMRVEVTRDTLAVRGDLFGPELPLGKLAPTAARVIDPAGDAHLRIEGPIFGGGFAGYRSGWYRLSDGTRAQVFLREGQRAVHIPTQFGYGLLVSVPDPDALLRTLQKRYGLSRD